MKISEYIERAAAMEFMDAVEPSICFDSQGCVFSATEDGDMLDYLLSIPAADVRPVVRGTWGYRWKIHGDGRRPTELFPCSVCGFENTSATNFCPNCGADMRGGKDDGV